MKKEINPQLDVEIDKILKEIGLRLKTKRKSIFNNYEYFAKEFDMNKVTVYRAETGENVSLKTIITIARALGISLEELFKGIE